MVDGFRGLDSCVHCGFCLQSCPTFLATGDEADSPRGRIVLMRGLERGQLDPDDPHLIGHLDRCLGCRACEPVCPSGVQYGPALEAARYLLAGRRRLPAAAQTIHAIMAEPLLRRPLLALARLIRPASRLLAGRSRAGFTCGMLAATRSRRGVRRQRPASVSTSSPAGALPRAALFRGCIMDGLFSHVHAATERVLRANRWSLVDVAGQGCCGALYAHGGQREAAATLARQNVLAFERAPESLIAVNSAGCGALLKEYAHLLAGDPLHPAAEAFAARVRDISELLADGGTRRGAPLELRVAYDPPCHLLHAQRVSDAPLHMLDTIPGLVRVRLAEADLCCGSAGSYSLTQPDLSRQILARKIAAIVRAAPDVVVTGNPGCVMQIGAGLLAARHPIAVLHPVELLDRSYQQAGYYAN